MCVIRDMQSQRYDCDVEAAVAPFARYVISATRAQDSAVPHQKGVTRIMAGNCRLRGCQCVASGEVTTEQCSVANCLNYTGTSNVSFISLYS